MHLDGKWLQVFIVGNLICFVSESGKVLEFAMKNGRQDDVNTYIPAQDLTHGSPDLKKAEGYIATGSVLLVYLSNGNKHEFWTLDLMFSLVLFICVNMTSYLFSIDAFLISNPYFEKCFVLFS